MCRRKSNSLTITRRLMVFRETSLFVARKHSLVTTEARECSQADETSPSSDACAQQSQTCGQDGDSVKLLTSNWHPHRQETGGANWSRAAANASNTEVPVWRGCFNRQPMETTSRSGSACAGLISESKNRSPPPPQKKPLCVQYK
jgi:hypothetical protein